MVEMHLKVERPTDQRCLLCFHFCSNIYQKRDQKAILVLIDFIFQGYLKEDFFY
jgi:hypothetical protein